MVKFTVFYQAHPNKLQRALVNAQDRDDAIECVANLLKTVEFVIIRVEEGWNTEGWKSEDPIT